MAYLDFQRGNPDRPLGHALFYVRGSGQDEILASYIVVLPITVDISRYLPPLLAGNLPSHESGEISALPWPPVPERVPGQAHLESLAELRGDDLLFGGTVDASRVELLVQATSEAAREYAERYSRYAASTPSPSTSVESAASSESDLDVDEVLYGLMGEHDRLTELVKLTGALRDAVERGSKRDVEEAATSLQRLARRLPASYNMNEFLAIASEPGERARRLAELYVDRCYRMANEDYSGLREVDERIAAVKQGRS